MSQGTGNQADIVLPATVTSSNLPTFSCYIATNSLGPWVFVPFTFVTDAPFCGLFVRADGRVEIRLRSWIANFYYYVAATWK